MPLQDISSGGSQVYLTFHLFQADGSVGRRAQCEDGHGVRRTRRRGERVWKRCSRIIEGGGFRERVKIEVVLSSNT